MTKRCSLVLSGFLLMCGLLSGCMMTSQPAAMLYDLGPPSSEPADRVFPENMPLPVVYQITSPDWLGNTMMYYRLTHVNAQQTRFYTLSRWNMPPTRLFRDRLESRLLSAGSGAGKEQTLANASRLVIHIEDFSQHFRDDSASEGRVALRVSVLDKNGLLSRKRFMRVVAAPSPDAPGGARALSAATDEVIEEILSWIAGNHGI